MSWSKHVTIKKGESAFNVIVGAPVYGNDDCPTERDRAAAVASGKAVEIIDSGVLGDYSENSFSVSISGHSNPGGNPRSPGKPDSTRDFVSIQIHQVATE